MALLPPVPARPSDRPESWSAYQHRRAVLALHRQQLDQIGEWMKRDPAQWHWGLSAAADLTEALFPIRQPRSLGILQDAMIEFTFKCRDR